MMNPPPEELLPRNLRALIQEHTAGGYLLFKIGADGSVQHILEYDDEKSYQAIMRKNALFTKTMKKIDEQMILSSMFSGAEQFFADEDDEDDYEEEDESGDY